jgi:hypothetical protein
MMFYLRVAKGAVEPPTKRAMPTSEDAGGIVCRQPLPRGAMLLTFVVGESRRCSQRLRSGGGVDRFAICADGNKLIHEFHVGNHRIDWCHQEVFLLRCELIEEVLIVQMNDAQEEHDLENLRDGHQRAREGRKVPLEMW